MAPESVGVVAAASGRQKKPIRKLMMRANATATRLEIEMDRAPPGAVQGRRLGLLPKQMGHVAAPSESFGG